MYYTINKLLFHWYIIINILLNINIITLDYFLII